MFIKIKVHPKAKKQKVEKISTKKFEIFVKADTKQNQANKEVLELLADFLKIEPKQIRIISGHHRPNKMLEVK